MNWLVSHLMKEARGRRFNPQDKVRYFTEGRKGKGRGIVLTPTFSKGTVVDFDPEKRHYRIKNNNDEIVDIHPRNLVPDGFSQVTPVVDMPSPEGVVPETLPQ